MAFDPILHEGFERVQPLEPDLLAAHDAMRAADHLVFIFPLWHGTLPAIFKGFLERVLQPDLVGSSKQAKFPKLLKGKSARVIIYGNVEGSDLRAAENGSRMLKNWAGGQLSWVD